MKIYKPTEKDMKEFNSDIENAMNKLNEFLGVSDGYCKPCEIGEILNSVVDSGYHNCIGCSFKLAFINAKRTLYEHLIVTNDNKDNWDMKFVLHNYFSWLNLIVEQVKNIANVLKSNKINSNKINIHNGLFEGLFLANKMTNMFKHPKALAFTHHLMYVMEYHRKDLGLYERVQFDDILPYFTGSNKNKSYTAELLFDNYANKIIAVELNRIEDITSEFINDFSKFIEIIRNDNDYINFLSQSSNLKI